MLAHVKKPPIEFSTHGRQADKLISIASTDFWQEMEKNRIGNLLEGARLKTGLT